MLSILLGNREPKADTGDFMNPLYWKSYGNQVKSTSGKVVTDDAAMNVATVYACVRILAESVAGLPCITYRRRPDGGKERAKGHWLYSVLRDQPNGVQTAFEFFELMMWCLTVRGNFVGEVDWGAETITCVLPEEIKEAKLNKVYGQYRPVYKVNTDGRERTLGADSVVHVRGLSKDGFWGYSPIELLKNAIGIAMSSEEVAAKQFENGVTPSGVFEHPNKLSPEAFAKLKASMAEHAGSGNARRTLILEEGMKWTPISMTNEDAQFLESRKMQIEEIARPFRVPLHMLQSLDRATFNNIEHLAIEFVTHTLRPWLVRIEQAIKRDMVLQSDTMFVEFMTDSLLRGDTMGRYQAYQIGLQNEFLNPNEVRNFENLNPRDGGEQYKNPAINPVDKTSRTDQSSNDAPLEPVQPKNAVQQLAAAYARDLAHRFAERELHQVGKRAKHSTTDRQKFNTWLQEFYTGHAQYVDQSLSGLCDALEVRAVDRIAIVEKLSRTQAAELRDSVADRVLEKWSESLATKHYNTIMEIVA